MASVSVYRKGRSKYFEDDGVAVGKDEAFQQLMTKFKDAHRNNNV